VGDERVVGFALAAKDAALGALSQDVTWTFAGHAENDVQRRDRVVDRAVARLHAALARQAALALNREGRFDEARQLIERVARKIASYAGTDLELRRIASELQDEVEAFAMHMDALQAKQRHFASYSVQHSRMADGKARKRR
jgi:ABC-type transporter Mla subunit MlaD